MKKNYVVPSVEAYMLDQADIVTASVTSIGDGDFGVRAEHIFGA